MKRIIFAALLLAISAPALAAPPELPPLDIEETFFSPETGGKTITLSKDERDSLALIQKWKSGQSVAPTQATDGTMRYLFGAQYPSIVCAVMQITDVELETGEAIQSIHLGDTARWSVEPAVTGSGAGEIQHLVIKPLDTGLKTSLLVTTDRRTYHLQLKSHRTDYMPRVTFIYPNAVLGKFQAMREQAQNKRQERVLPESGEYLGDLDFDYEIDGKDPRPVRVYNDGRKTIIQMPASMEHGEAPTLLILDGKEEVLANYRLQGDRYIVDTVFDSAKLIAGVGKKQRKVVITRVNRSK